MGKTILDKIWDAHVVAARDDGKDLLYIDRHLVHELHGSHALKKVEDKGRKVRRPDLTIAVLDHTIATVPSLGRSSVLIDALRDGAGRHGLNLFDVDTAEHGIVHVVSPELGVALPGLTLACPDSHASTVGAIGTLAFGTGTTELEHVFATQVMAMAKPKQMRIWFDGRLGPCVGAKDVALHLIRNVGVDAGSGYAVEYAGNVISDMDIEARLTLCNLTIEWGARTCLIAPDDKTIAWCAGRRAAPKDELWDAAVAWWRTLPSDPDAHFDKELRLDCSQLEPQISWGTDPSQVIGITEPIPEPDKAGGKAERALQYMELAPGRSLIGTPVQRVFIGSCSNSRISDLRLAAAVAKGRKVAGGVQAIVVPGSLAVKKQAESEGLDLIFRQAGFEWRESGCSMCAGTNGDVGLPGERCISTTNRNFENRQGKGVKTHLASPAMAVAAAVTGTIADVRDIVRS